MYALPFSPELGVSDISDDVKGLRHGDDCRLKDASRTRRSTCGENLVILWQLRGGKEVRAGEMGKAVKEGSSME